MSTSIVYKPPKGTCDYRGAEQCQREKLVNACITTFRLYNTEPMDTPSFEVTEAITKGCTSDTSKETFELVPEDEGSERYTLRYDQTMPFARYTKQQKITKMRRYQIGYVYRRDQPNMSNARFRQFLQADYDNLGTGQDVPSVDGETILILSDILRRMNLRDCFVIKINSVGLLKDALKWCKIDKKLFEPVCKCLDKIQKQKWKKVKTELIDLGLDEPIVDQLKQLIDLVWNTYQTGLPDFRRMDFMSDETAIYFSGLFEYINLVLAPIKLAIIL